MRRSKFKLEDARRWAAVAIGFMSLAWSVLAYFLPATAANPGAEGTAGSGHTVAAPAGVGAVRAATVDLPWWAVIAVWAVEAAATVAVFWVCEQLLYDGRFFSKPRYGLRVLVGAVTASHLFVFHLWLFWPRLTAPGVAASVLASGIIVFRLWRWARAR